jgi:hypothetical protein
VVHSLPPYIKDIFLFLLVSSNPSVSKLIIETMLLHFCHSAYNKMCIIPFPSFSSSPSMHWKISCLTFYLSCNLSLYIFTPVYILRYITIIYQLFPYSSSIKMYNRLPTRIKQLSGDVNKFKLALRRFFLDGSFYTIEEFLHWSTSSDLNDMYLCWLLKWLD